jgi:hypothetical protein
MTKFIVNSEESLQRHLGAVRDDYRQFKYLHGSYRAGTHRSLSQNAIIHTWYAQIARELREDDELGWKSFCKLHFGVPILRLDDEFRDAYDAVIKPIDYEKKLIAMRCWPVTSIMTKEQLSAYAEAMIDHFATLAIMLTFPESERDRRAA